ncbi:serine hydrolase [Kistimonas scapharcae]|uniref:Serine hydrolase n=1 Tax=Kistimonas scapharcae TaxID=1036133 RepID=A0ABP8UYA5_9GAMM
MVTAFSPPPDFTCNKELDIGHNDWDKSEYLALSQTQMARFFPTLEIDNGPVTAPLHYAETPWDINGTRFSDPLIEGRNISGEQLLNRRLYNDGLLVLHRGSVVHESYRNGLRPEDRHVIHSCSKSLCAMVAAKAIDEDRLDTRKRVIDFLPELAQHRSWADIRVQHLMDMQAGLRYSENYADDNADYWSYSRAAGYYPPTAEHPAIGIRRWTIEQLHEPQHPPGTAFVYNSCLTNVLAMVLEAACECPFPQLLEDKLYRHIGAEQTALFNTDSQGFGIIEGQINLCLRDLARVGMLALNEGVTALGERLLPAHFFQDCYRPDTGLQAAYHAENRDPVFADGQYHNQFWIFEPHKSRYAMLGIHGQFVWIDKAQELLIAGLGSYPHQDSHLMLKTLNTLWQGIAVMARTR